MTSSESKEPKGSEHSSSELFAPGDEGAIERVRSVLESEAVVGRSALEYRGLITSALMEPEKPELRCTCGCRRGDHFGRPRACIPHGFHEFVCDHTRCGWKPRAEEPEPRCEGCGHTEGEGCGCPPRCTCGPDEACSECPEMPPEEPPLTPEEEEEAPGDVSPEEMDRRWAKAMGDDEPPPPQPDRRPPYAVAYSVQGHLYEVALPGDATVKAVDGALVIQHHLGPVAGIVSVLPVINKES